MTEATSPPSVAECSQAEYHGNPFRYCSCGWMEETDPDKTLAERFTDLESTVAELVKATEKQNELLQTISDSVGPAIEGLKSSAIGKMFGI